MFLIKLGMRPWMKSTFSQMLTGIGLAALVSIMGVIWQLDRKLGPVVRKLNREQTVTVFLKPIDHAKVEANNEKSFEIVDQIRAEIGAKNLDVKFTSTADFLAETKTAYPDLYQELDAGGAEVQALLPEFVTVSGEIRPEQIEKLKTFEFTESIDSSRQKFLHAAGAFQALRWIGRFFLVGLLLTLASGILHLSRILGYFHVESTRVIKQWGGGFWQLRAPALISGLSLGAFSSLITLAIWVGLGQKMVILLQGLSPFLKDIEVPQSSLTVVMAAASLFVGLVSGWLSSQFALSDNLRRN